jgi:hypothetical protein
LKAQYFFRRQLNNRILPDSIALAYNANEESIIHEYGHLIDSVMGRQPFLFGGLYRWCSEKQFAKEVDAVNSAFLHEQFAKMFVQLVYNGTSGNSWFDKTIGGFCREN